VTPGDSRALVAIDLGAESCRVSLLRWVEGAPKIQLVHRFPNNAQHRGDELHWDLQGILGGLDAGLRQCAAIASEGIRSIAVDGWGVDYVRLDAHGAAVGQPFCYRDERTVASEAALHERITPERMREITGVQLLRLNTLYQLAADEPELQKLRWLNLPEYVLYSLGGRPVAELTIATHTQLVGLDGAWSSEIFDALGQDETLAADLVDPGTDVGQLRGELATLPAFADTRLIAPACHDTASAIAAVADAGDDWAYISSGTWSLVGTLLTKPANGPAAREENFTNLAGTDGTICFHKNVNGMWMLRQCMEEWNAADAVWTVEQLVAAAEGVAPPGYLLDVDEAELMLPGHMPERINAQLRGRGVAELSVDAKDAPAMAAFLFHSLAARYAEVLGKIAEISGKKFARIYLMGGGSQNLLLNRLTAEATGLEVCRAGTECSTVGNFAVQLSTLEAGDGGSVTRREQTCAWARLLAAP
jgi:rhamnulokinase